MAQAFLPVRVFFIEIRTGMNAYSTWSRHSCLQLYKLFDVIAEQQFPKSARRFFHGSLLISIEMRVRILGDRLDQAARVGVPGPGEYLGRGPAFYDPAVVQNRHPVAQAGNR